MRRAAFLVSLVSAIAVGGAQASAVGDVTKVLLTKTDFANAYTVAHPAGWNQVKSQVTLDLCGFRYRSEALRTARMQVWFLQQHPVLSNEVVAYKPRGAALALSEVRTAVKHCPSGYVQSNVQGVGQVKNQITLLPATGLLPGTIALEDHVTQKSSTGALQSYVTIAVFQARKNVLSGIYALGDSERGLAFRAARLSAARLRAL